jgi:hypothetical protein
MSKAIKFKNKNNEEVYPCPFYPIGSIYLSLNNTNPSTYFGGKWELIKDRFLIGAGNSYSASTTGGATTVTLKQENLPSRTMVRTSGSSGSACNINVSVSSGYSNHCLYDAGLTSDKSFSILPPYIAVYIWKRVS